MTNLVVFLPLFVSSVFVCVGMCLFVFVCGSMWLFCRYA